MAAILHRSFRDKDYSVRPSAMRNSWAGEFILSDEDRLLPFDHLAFQTKKSEDELAAIAKKHGAVLKQEERGLPAVVSVVYELAGNFLEFFPPINA